MRLRRIIAWFYRCPECGRRPYRRWDSTSPQWRADSVVQRFGWIDGRCGDCGGLLEQEDTR